MTTETCAWTLIWVEKEERASWFPHFLASLQIGLALDFSAERVENGREADYSHTEPPPHAPTLLYERLEEQVSQTGGWNHCGLRSGSWVAKKTCIHVSSWDYDDVSNSYKRAISFRATAPPATLILGRSHDPASLLCGCALTERGGGLLGNMLKTLLSAGEPWVEQMEAPSFLCNPALVKQKIWVSCDPLDVGWNEEPNEHPGTSRGALDTDEYSD